MHHVRDLPLAACARWVRIAGGFAGHPRSLRNEVPQTRYGLSYGLTSKLSTFYRLLLVLSQRGSEDMPPQNRVDPFGDILELPLRGLFTGNRGIIHDPASRTLTTKRWASKSWLILQL